jgi:hypothetical protein
MDIRETEVKVANIKSTIMTFLIIFLEGVKGLKDQGQEKKPFIMP